MNAKEDAFVDLNTSGYAKALQTWVENCSARMKARWPQIVFDSDHWPLNSHYKTRLRDVSFAAAVADFEGKDPAYVLALKCIMAEVALKGDLKDPYGQIPCWRLLSRLGAPLHQLRRANLTELEDALMQQTKDTPSKAHSTYRDLMTLRAHIDLIGSMGVTDRLAWSPSPPRWPLQTPPLMASQTPPGRTHGL